MYDHDPEEVESLGWEEFIARQWESIFTGYRSWTGLRRMGRRWGDLLEAGLGCSQDLADQLVRAQVVDRPDRDLEGTGDAHALVVKMMGVVADVRADLADLGEENPDLSARLLDQHAQLMRFIRVCAFGRDDAGAPQA